MKNSLCFTTGSGKIRYVEFAHIWNIRPIRNSIAGIYGRRYYCIYVTDVFYTDTGEHEEETRFRLFEPGDRVTYHGKTYKFDNLDRLCMVVENENNIRVLDSL
jgi:hypothetical protein